MELDVFLWKSFTKTAGQFLRVMVKGTVHIKGGCCYAVCSDIDTLVTHHLARWSTLLFRVLLCFYVPALHLTGFSALLSFIRAVVKFVPLVPFLADLSTTNLDVATSH